MKVKAASLYLSLVFTAVFVAGSPADNRDDSGRKWQENRQRYELVDEERALLKQSDQLTYEIMDLKRNINDLQKRLSMAQSKLDDVRYNLVSVKMKLMP
jgi:septal ring factor EnvC (AmiA/AmiB activator)